MDLRRSPWLLYPGDVGGEIRPNRARTFIQSIAFSNYTDPDHRCVIEDGDGRVVFDRKGTTGLDPVEVSYASTSQFPGLVLVQLDSGDCHIHIK